MAKGVKKKDEIWKKTMQDGKETPSSLDFQRRKILNLLVYFRSIATLPKHCYQCFGSIAMLQKQTKGVSIGMLPKHCNASKALQRFLSIAMLPKHCNTSQALQRFQSIATLPKHCSTSKALQRFPSIEMLPKHCNASEALELRESVFFSKKNEKIKIRRNFL